MASDPLRVLVWAAFPALRAGISQLLRREGLATCELVSLDALQDGGAPGDVLAADVEDAASALEVLRTGGSLELPTLLMAPDDLVPPDSVFEADRGVGWVARSASPADLAAALRAVAAGFLVTEPGLVRPLLSADQDEQSMQAASATSLTPREVEVLQWLALGLPNKTIALRLGISEHTVKFHVGSVLSKLDAASRTEAVTTAARRGLLAL
ncbi:MAG TPA: response regulator transcription factor [Dehalococcoidia bacterium]|nr:response regulator transcription factor [Dehalococcoidia bacterium]